MELHEIHEMLDSGIYREKNERNVGCALEEGPPPGIERCGHSPGGAFFLGMRKTGGLLPRQ